VSYLFDTNICIAMLRSAEPLHIEKMQRHQPADFLHCSVAKAELLYGARKSQRVDKNLALLAGLFALFSSLAFDDRAAESTVPTAPFLNAQAHRLVRPIC
jgi:tRNA(fMet)-specific endonuclease VapC